MKISTSQIVWGQTKKLWSTNSPNKRLRAYEVNYDVQTNVLGTEEATNMATISEEIIV